MSTIYSGHPSTRESRLANEYPTSKHPAPLTNEQLNSLRDECRRLGRPLTDAERDSVLGVKTERVPCGLRVVEVDQ